MLMTRISCLILREMFFLDYQFAIFLSRFYLNGSERSAHSSRMQKSLTRLPLDRFTTSS